MIPVAAAPEPHWFDAKVRVPGAAHLATQTPPPWTFRPALWRWCLPHMRDVYDDTCAYLGMRINRATAYATVDHFLPRRTDPHLAYEWTNFRLAAVTVNTNKGDQVLPVDPFDIQPGEFQLDLLTGEVRPGVTGRPAQVDAAIAALKLNSAQFVDERLEYIDSHLRGEISRAVLERWFPFGAVELARRGL